MNYPRCSAYAANRGYGWPLTQENKSGSPLNGNIVGLLARYSTITLNLSPWYAVDEPCRPDVLLALRKVNPSICILGYQLLAWWYLGPSFTVASWDKTFAGTWHTAIKSTGGFGMTSGTGWNVRWDNPATEAALTKLLCDAAASRLFDGLFFDFMSAANTASLDAMQRMVHAVRKAGGYGFLVQGNGWSDSLLAVDGAFREGFPTSLGHDFEHARNWRAGRPHVAHDWLQAGTGVTDPTTPDAQRQVRFALGTACLFDCQCSFGPDRDLSVTPSYLTWWNEVYDNAGAGPGWLGEPMGPARLEGLLYRRDFGGGIVYVNANGSPLNVPVPPGHSRIGGPEMGTVTVPAKDSVFLMRVL